MPNSQHLESDNDSLASAEDSNGTTLTAMPSSTQKSSFSSKCPTIPWCPPLLDMTLDECLCELRDKEVLAYRGLLEVFRTQGDCSKEKLSILSQVRQILSIPEVMHRALLRSVIADETLATVCDHIWGRWVDDEWINESRHRVPVGSVDNGTAGLLTLPPLIPVAAVADVQRGKVRKRNDELKSEFIRVKKHVPIPVNVKSEHATPPISVADIPVGPKHEPAPKVANSNAPNVRSKSNNNSKGRRLKRKRTEELSVLYPLANIQGTALSMHGFHAEEMAHQEVCCADEGKDQMAMGLELLSQLVLGNLPSVRPSDAPQQMRPLSPPNGNTPANHHPRDLDENFHQSEGASLTSPSAKFVSPDVSEAKSQQGIFTSPSEFYQQSALINVAKQSPALISPPQRIQGQVIFSPEQLQSSLIHPSPMAIPSTIHVTATSRSNLQGHSRLPNGSGMPLPHNAAVVVKPLAPSNVASNRIVAASSNAIRFPVPLQSNNYPNRDKLPAQALHVSSIPRGGTGSSRESGVKRSSPYPLDSFGGPVGQPALTGKVRLLSSSPFPMPLGIGASASLLRPTQVPLVKEQNTSNKLRLLKLVQQSLDQPSLPPVFAQVILSCKKSLQNDRFATLQHFLDSFDNEMEQYLMINKDLSSDEAVRVCCANLKSNISRSLLAIQE